ncbi:MAG TPA: hypothetical protein VKB19_07775 [Pedobacter sp.]|nr:hypothetical protein [Pedobacter sp.]
MGIFSFLTNNKQQEPVFDNYRSDTTAETNSKGIDEEIFIEKDTTSATVSNSEQTSVQTIITNNLEQLYSFLDRNMESKGYDDALTNPDSYHLDQNLDALRKELMRTIKRVKTFYEDFIREIDYHIESRSRSGMIDTVEELKMKKEIAGSHIEKVLLIETDALNKEGDSEGIIISYTRGFRNGLAAISHHTIISKKF